MVEHRRGAVHPHPHALQPATLRRCPACAGSCHEHHSSASTVGHTARAKPGRLLEVTARM